MTELEKKNNEYRLKYGRWQMLPEGAASLLWNKYFKASGMYNVHICMN